MYKSQLQELAQRSCFNLPSYGCMREGPDHAPRFKACVNFNGEIFESSTYSATLRKAEHAAAQVALNVLSTRGPSRSLTARILDETGVYKNLLQETAHRTGLKLPVYTTTRSGPGHAPVFTCTVELAAMIFTGESARTKKQAEKNAAIAAWSSFKKMQNLDSISQTSKEIENGEEAVVARVLSNFRPSEDKIAMRRRGMNPMELVIERQRQKQKQNSFLSLLPPPPPRTTSKILQTTLSRDTSSSSSLSTDHRPSSMMTMAQSQVKMKEVALDEHKKDEDKWVSGESDGVMMNKAFVGKEEAVFGVGDLNMMRGRVVVGTPPTSPMSMPMPTKSNHMGIRNVEIGGYPQMTRRRIAPAVQMRSVIPVCATPTPSLRLPQPSSSIKQTAAATTTTTATTMFNNKQMQVNTKQLSTSDFNYKLQL